MHRGHRRVGKCLPGQAGAQQHGLARRQVATVVYRLVEVAGQQPQRFAGQQAGHRVALEPAGGGLDGMDHGIDTGGGSDRRWQAQGALGVEQRQVGQQQRRNDRHLGRLAGGDHGDRGDLGAGPGGGRHLDQWQARALGLVDAIDRLQGLVTGGVCQQRHQLGDIHGAAATETDDQLGADMPRPAHRRQHAGMAGVGADLTEDRHAQVSLGEPWQ
ncbi:hypothetical protein D3C76_1039560 [compost metagenome]